MYGEDFHLGPYLLCVYQSALNVFGKERSKIYWPERYWLVLRCLADHLYIYDFDRHPYFIGI